MLKNLKKLFSPRPFQEEAHKAYLTLVARSRAPWFYQTLGVPDTIDGRFDVMVLHMFLLLHRLRGDESQQAGQFIRAVSEVFFADMDRSLREMGVGDTGISHRVKKMASAFYGRMNVYEQNLHKEKDLEAAIGRNLYRSENPPACGDIAAYMLRNVAHLSAQAEAGIIRGELSFVD